MDGQGDTPTDALAHLREALDEASIASLVHGLDVDAALDRRDRPDFEEAWKAGLDAVSPEEADLDAAVRDSIDSIRERAYKLSYAATQHPEFAGAVSDDFGLIATAAAVGMRVGFVVHLRTHYLNGKFPIDVGGVPP